MTESPTIRLQLLGDPAAVACEGDSCAVLTISDQATVNRRLDQDEV